MFFETLFYRISGFAVIFTFASRVMFAIVFIDYIACFAVDFAVGKTHFAFFVVAGFVFKWI